MVSGDWREVGAGLELIEVLALAKSQPGVPLLSASFRDGRQRSLVAAGGIHPGRPTSQSPPVVGGYRRQLARSVADLVVGEIRADLRAAGVLPSLDQIEQAALTAAATEHAGAMVALVPSRADCDRLAVEGGEPATELHLTLAYLGEADAIDAETRAAIITAAWDAVEKMGPVEADGFSVSVFNPGDENDRDTCIVVGVSGDALAAAHTDVGAAVGEVFTAPDQHQPFAAHVTLAYSDDLSMVEEIAESRVGPIVFDRLRIAFAGEVTDIVLGDPAPADTEQAAAALLAETAAALAAVDAHARSLKAAEVMRELEATSVRV
jgi:2'-5' RNA ligase